MKNKLMITFCLFILTASCFAQKAKIAGSSGGDITKELLMTVKTLDVDAPLKILSFSMTYTTVEGLEEFDVIGLAFTPDMLQAIKGSKGGEKLCFENIIAMDDKGAYKLPAMTFKIK